MEMVDLSVLIIARNEEDNLPRLLESLNLLQVPHEVVVVDAFSQDRTPEIARSHGARVYQREWKGYREQREYALSLARGRWVLFLDADEWLTPEVAREISDIVRRDGPCDGYRLRRRNVYLGKLQRKLPEKIERLGRREKMSISGQYVHERPFIEGRICTTRNYIMHLPYRDLRHHWEKNTRYAYLSALEKYERGRGAGILDLTLRPMATFLKHYFLQLNFLDGWRGLVYSISQSWYVFQKYAFLRELRLRRTDSPDEGQ